MLRSRALLGAIALTLISSPATFAEEPDSTHADPRHAAHEHAAPRGSDHAPIGVMGDHRHAQGEVMLSYRFMRMDMNGNRDGSSRRSATDVRRDFPVAPVDMDMEMHMFGGMWAPTDRVTLMAMVPFVRLDMKHITRTGRRFVTRSKGLGDIRLSALIGLYDDETHHVHLNAGLSLPTGTTTAKDDTPAGRQRLPYPMQIGSGTWDLLPGITYSGRREAWSWGSQVRATIRTDRNRHGYRRGHDWGVTGWLARDFGSWLSGSLRLDYADTQNFSGDDDEFMPAVVPTADPNRRAGRVLSGLLGLNVVVPKGPLAGHRLGLEVGIPLVQHLDGPQLERDWTATLGWQYAF